MSESLSPERITLASRLDFKREPLERPHSPDLNCAICLEEFDNKSFTDTCLHQFCYHCLREWSKIKPECPLCKQRFRTIIHNVRSISEYEEHHVETHVPISADTTTPTVLINLAFQRPPFPYRNALDYRTRIEGEMYRATLSPYDREDSSLLYIRQYGEMMPEAPPGGRPFTRSAAAAAATAVAPPPPVVGTSRHRREIYRQNRWVRADTSGRVRESSPAFYRANRAQTHRLVPWLIRELNVLLDVSMDSQVVCSEILSLILAHPIQSREFRDRVRLYLGNRADHFVHEFYNFAISAHDMVAYDLTAEYGAGMPERPWRLANSLPESSTSSDSDPDNDSDLELVNVVHLHVDKKPGGSSGSCGSGLRLEQAAGPSGLSYPLGMSDTVIEIESTTSESSEDEVQIIGTIAPISPETITLESSSEEEAGEGGQNGCPSLPSCSYLNDTKKNLLDVKDDFLSYILSPSLAEAQPQSSALVPSPLSTNPPSPPSLLTHSVHSSSPSSSSSSLSSSSSSPSSTSSSSFSPSATSSSDGSEDEGTSRKRYVKRKRRKRSIKKEPKKRKYTTIKKKVIRYTSDEDDDEENTEEAMETKHETRKETAEEGAESEEEKEGRNHRKEQQVNSSVGASTSPKNNSSTATEEEAEDEEVDVEGNGDSETEKDYRGRLRSVVVPASKCAASRWLWTPRVVDYSDHSVSESHSD